MSFSNVTSRAEARIDSISYRLSTPKKVLSLLPSSGAFSTGAFAGVEALEGSFEVAAEVGASAFAEDSAMIQGGLTPVGTKGQSIRSSIGNRRTKFGEKASLLEQVSTQYKLPMLKRRCQVWRKALTQWARPLSLAGYGERVSQRRIWRTSIAPRRTRTGTPEQQQKQQSVVIVAISVCTSRNMARMHHGGETLTNRWNTKRQGPFHLHPARGRAPMHVHRQTLGVAHMLYLVLPYTTTLIARVRPP